MGARLRLADDVVIDEDELVWRFTTSGGPGGQHANRSATRAEVRFDIAASPSLDDWVRARLRTRLGDVVRVASDEERSQWQNRQRAVAKLAEQIGRALTVERPRRATRPTAGSRRRRVDAKRKRSQVKRLRGRVTDD